ncbi:hypothetical protein GUITHDRAFT_117771 [Guillardia theta CCMP2712]|uniref:Uncharacterized protein n=1 Tax=Guillardia theta (strain CCMP2712) TaxID=905079 RepID=L1IIP0_GUITC|nr:hypothetical protein GUITHDRAFT_117771 [Guillardia theta CCMP2712]EKX36101.1 hypothetical protein GUITHDRAFT_117771 [Guillardia theta CCMP2712]|eukprot:XP_005823081.1 hypothetical protein GUITHDRAFT_117771 [Guillardia theta CCMP2712]
MPTFVHGLTSERISCASRFAPSVQKVGEAIIVPSHASLGGCKGNVMPQRLRAQMKDGMPPEDNSRNSLTRENDQFQMFKRFKTMALLAVVSLLIANSPVPSMAAEALSPAGVSALQGKLLG